MKDKYYAECHKTHKHLNGKSDGCQEFLAAEGSLYCSVCGCHMNYHRKVVKYATEVVYTECHKYHRGWLGSSYKDGCKEFVPGGFLDGGPKICAACGCHKSFHMNEVEQESKRTTPQMIVPKVLWQPPAQGWVKLNSDGASKGNPGPSGIGGVIRDPTCSVISGFSDYIGVCSNMVAELKAILFGLKLCIEKNFHRVCLEIDSKAAIDLIHKPLPCNWSFQYLVMEIQKILQQMEVRISHIFREGNKAADELANLGVQRKTLQIFDGTNLPHAVKGLVRIDELRLPSFRIQHS